MNLKQYCHYQFDFKCRWGQACPILMGLSFFATMLYYFAIVTLRALPATMVIGAVLYGVLMAGAFIVCMACLKLNAPGLYAIFGAAQCLGMILVSFSSGSAVKIIFAIIWYLFAGLVILATAGGYLPGRLLCSIVFFVPVFVRVLFYDLGKLGLFQWVGELSVLLMLCGLGCFAMALTSDIKRKR